MKAKWSPTWENPSSPPAFVFGANGHPHKVLNIKNFFATAVNRLLTIEPIWDLKGSIPSFPSKILTNPTEGAFLPDKFSLDISYYADHIKTPRQTQCFHHFCYISFSTLCLSAEENDSKLQAIEKRLAALEQENAKLKERIAKLEKSECSSSGQTILRYNPTGWNREKSIFW